MQVMLLAAGRSTRLGGLGERIPKPLVPICGYPAIAFSLTLCRRFGCDDVVINVHHHGDQIRATLGDAAYGVSIRYSVEEDLLGTGGGIARARSLFTPGPVLIINAKVIADMDLEAVAAAHREAVPGTLATMALREDSNPGRWSRVVVDTAGRVISLRGQGRAGAASHTVPRTFVGVHVVEPALLDYLPAGVSDVIGDAYIPALVAGARIGSTLRSGFFADPSTPEDYLAVNLALLRDPTLLPNPPGPLVGIDEGAYVAPSASVVMPSRVAAGAVVEAHAQVGPEAVICAGARVAEGAHVERSVVWPGAVADGRVAGAVVT
jgi:NDP-sugar pyrophosphorylase family protein